MKCATSSVDRVPGYEPVGRRFESCVARKTKQPPNRVVVLFCATLHRIRKGFAASGTGGKMRQHFPRGSRPMFALASSRAVPPNRLPFLFSYHIAQDSERAHSLTRSAVSTSRRGGQTHCVRPVDLVRCSHLLHHEQFHPIGWLFCFSMKRACGA